MVFILVYAVGLAILVYAYKRATGARLLRDMGDALAVSFWFSSFYFWVRHGLLLFLIVLYHVAFVGFLYLVAGVSGTR